MKIQDHEIEILEKLNGEYFIGKEVLNEYVNKKINIINAEFVDPTNATGLVMSVPAHAPFDYVALVTAIGKIEADKIVKPVIKSDKELGEIPARTIVEQMNITDLKDEKLICKNAHNANLFKATPENLYINWAAAMQSLWRDPHLNR